MFSCVSVSYNRGKNTVKNNSPEKRVSYPGKTRMPAECLNMHLCKQLAVTALVLSPSLSYQTRSGATNSCEQ